MNHRILLPTNGSLPALVATRTAVRIAKDRGATLIILRVIEQDASLYIEHVSEDVGTRGGTGVDGVAFALRLAEEAGLKTEVLEKEGAVTGEILKASEEAEVSMIVMGSSNPHGLSGLYLGNVAEAVTRKAKVSVYIVKPTEEEMEEALALTKPALVVEEKDALSLIIHSRKFMVGLVLFSIYTIFYAAFTILGTFGRDILKERMLGLNLGIIMGLVVIVMAIVMAVTFNYYAVKVEKEGQ
ncbi:MAG: universal stress protein [Methanomassiliicoccales archaeon]|nr:universal stress protein [Methanomassiliicoccales archaeon]